jgi:hypothetical protein
MQIIGGGYGRDFGKLGGRKKVCVPEVGRDRRFQAWDHLGELSKVWEEKLRLCHARALGPWSAISLEHDDQRQELCEEREIGSGVTEVHARDYQVSGIFKALSGACSTEREDQ